MSRFISPGNCIITPLEKLNHLREALELLEKKVAFLKKKVSAEGDMAEKHLWAKNETAAMHCIKSKLMYEHEIKILGSYQPFIRNQMIVLESATATRETVEALRNGADKLKHTNKEMIIDNGDKMMDEINEQTEYVKQIQEALSAPIGAAADFDESLELEKRVSFLKKEVSAEVDMAKAHLRAKNKTAAIHCIKRKLAYEHEIEIRGSYQPFIRNQMILLECATATMETVEASRNGADTLKCTNKEMIINNGDKMMDEISEHTENVKLLQEALSAPIGAAADFDQAISTPLETLNQLREKLEYFQKIESIFKKKASAELDSAKEHARAKNKKAAVYCLKKKQMYEKQIEYFGNYQQRIQDQMIVLEDATATTETVAALRTGADALSCINEEMNINNADTMMDEITEQTENTKQIQEALSSPIGAAADSDEDKLEAELEELEASKLEEELLQPATTAPPAAVKCAIRETTDSPDSTSETS